MEIYKHVLGEVHDAILCKRKTAPTQSRTNMKPNTNLILVIHIKRI